MIGINIFAQPTLGMLKGLSEDVNTQVVSCYSVQLKREGKVFKFAYNICRESLNGMKADIVYGIIHKYECQVREHIIPNKDMLFTAIPEGESERLRIHRSAIHDAIIIANSSKANQVLLYFLFDPFEGFTREGIVTLQMFRREWRVRLFKVALFGDVLPAPYLWAIHAIKGKGIEKDVRVRDDKLVIDLPTISHNYSTERDEFINRTLLWDLSPWLCKEMWELIKSKPIGQERFTYFQTVLHVNKKQKERVLQGGDLYDLTTIDQNSTYIKSLSINDWVTGLGWGKLEEFKSTYNDLI